MKIHFLSPAYPFRGGIAQFAQMWAKALSQTHDVKIFTFTKQYPKWLFPGKTQRDKSAPPALNIEQIYCAWNPFSWWRTFRKIRDENSEMLIVKWWIPFFAPGYSVLLRLVKWFTKTKIVFSVDNAIPHEKWPFAKFLTQFTLKTGQWLIAHSSAVSTDLQKLGFPEDIIKIVPHPLYNQYQRSPSADGEIRKKLGITESRVLLFFGYIKKYKGLDILLDAMPKILEIFQNDIRLIIVGEFYYDKNEYEKQVINFDIANNITLVDYFVPDEEVGQYFQIADVMVLPYRTATQSGIVQVAYNFEKPTIVTNVGGLPEVVKDGITGYLIDPEDSMAVSEAVRKFYKERKTVNFSKNIRQQNAQFGWEKLVSLIDNLV